MQPQAENNGTLLTVIARLLLHDGYRAIFMSQKKLLQLSHFVSQQGDFILGETRDTRRQSKKWSLFRKEVPHNTKIRCRPLLFKYFYKVDAFLKLEISENRNIKTDLKIKISEMHFLH